MTVVLWLTLTKKLRSRVAENIIFTKNTYGSKSATMFEIVKTILDLLIPQQQSFQSTFKSLLTVALI